MKRQMEETLEATQAATGGGFRKLGLLLLGSL